MKLRSNHIVVAVLVALGAVVAYAYLSTRAPGAGPSGSSEDDFLAEVRRQAQQAPVGQEVGWEAPASEGDPLRAPRIELATTKYDMGVIAHDKATKGSVMVYNKGNSDLTIGEIKTQCACTIGEMARMVIPPGGEEPLQITVDPFRVPGFESHKVLSIYSSDHSKPVVQVTVSAQIDPEFTAEPKVIDFGKVPQGQLATAQIVIRQTGKDPVDVTSVEPYKNAKGITTTLKKRPESEWTEPGKPEYVIDVTLDPSQARPGPSKGHIVIKTNTPRLPTYFSVYEAEVVGQDGQTLAQVGPPVAPIAGPPELEDLQESVPAGAEPGAPATPGEAGEAESS